MRLEHRKRNRVKGQGIHKSQCDKPEEESGRDVQQALGRKVKAEDTGFGSFHIYGE